jgi:hypothetical protein
MIVIGRARASVLAVRLTTREGMRAAAGVVRPVTAVTMLPPTEETGMGT